jgi:hypothetical protein
VSMTCFREGMPLSCGRVSSDGWLIDHPKPGPVILAASNFGSHQAVGKVSGGERQVTGDDGRALNSEIKYSPSCYQLTVKPADSFSAAGELPVTDIEDRIGFVKGTHPVSITHMLARHEKLCQILGVANRPVGCFTHGWILRQ